MWEINHLGEIYDCNGSIGRAIQGNVNLAGLREQVPYINGNQATLDDTPPAGSVVTFRPRMSGKARQ